MRVVLGPGEMSVAYHVAALRRCVNQSGGITDARRDTALQAIELDILGMVSELAWAKGWNAYPDLSVSPRHGGIDSMIGGQRLDIKATARLDGQLLAHPGKRDDPADIYVLAVVRENVVNFVGWARASELLCEETITDLGHGPTHALPQHRLRRFKRDMGEGAGA